MQIFLIYKRTSNHNYLRILVICKDKGRIAYLLSNGDGVVVFGEVVVVLGRPVSELPQDLEGVQLEFVRLVVEEVGQRHPRTFRQRLQSYLINNVYFRQVRTLVYIERERERDVRGEKGYKEWHYTQRNTHIPSTIHPQLREFCRRDNMARDKSIVW